MLSAFVIFWLSTRGPLRPGNSGRLFARFPAPYRRQRQPDRRRQPEVCVGSLQSAARSQDQHGIAHRHLPLRRRQSPRPQGLPRRLELRRHGLLLHWLASPRRNRRRLDYAQPPVRRWQLHRRAPRDGRERRRRDLRLTARWNSGPRIRNLMPNSSRIGHRTRFSRLHVRGTAALCLWHSRPRR